MGAEQWASSKNSKLMRLFFFSIGRAFRAANWPWITLSRAENYAPRNDYNGSFKFSTRSRFSMGGGGAAFFFRTSSSSRRGHFSDRSWMETWFLFPLSVEKIYLRVWNGSDDGKRRSFSLFFVRKREKNVSNFW